MGHYFDYNASAPLAPEVREHLAALFTSGYGNPSSVHAAGQRARGEIDEARASVARLLGCAPREIVFTSGGTEGANLAILGCLRASPRGRHVITTSIEHPAVLGACAQLEREGASVTRVPVSSAGVVSVDDVRAALRPGTALVSVMHANNETGAVQPIAELAAAAREAGALMHSDGVQAAGRIAVDVRALGVDLYSISAHKLGALQGCGALYIREGVPLQALQFGGRHERERRAGTENVAGIGALGAAAGWWIEHGAAERARIAELRDLFETSLAQRVSNIFFNASGAPRTPNTSSVTIADASGEALLIALDLAGCAVSTGSACSSGAVEPSHVLTAMGLTDEQARASLRISFGRGNDAAACLELVAALAAAVERQRATRSFAV
jgi:cysteine desulfurase